MSAGHLDPALALELVLLTESKAQAAAVLSVTSRAHARPRTHARLSVDEDVDDGSVADVTRLRGRAQPQFLLVHVSILPPWDDGVHYLLHDLSHVSQKFQEAWNSH